MALLLPLFASLLGVGVDEQLFLNQFSFVLDPGLGVMLNIYWCLLLPSLTLLTFAFFLWVTCHAAWESQVKMA